MKRIQRVTAGLVAAAAMVATVIAQTLPAYALTGDSYNGPDNTTRGNWSYTYDLASGGAVRAYNYGTFGYVLPDGTGANEYEVGGQLTRNSSLDETGGPGFGDNAYAGELAGYHVHGPITPDNRTLELPGGTQRRATACFGSSVSMALPLAAGTYQIAVYAVDYDRGGRIQTTLSTAGGSSAAQTVSNFANGVYALYDVNTDGLSPVTLNTAAVAGPNTVVSGVFVDKITTSVSGVTAAGFDTTSQGNWIGKYGSTGYALCGINAGAVNTVFSWSPALDVSSGLGAYSVTGSVYAWTNTFTSGPITEPAYAYAWNSFEPQSSTDVASTTFWKNNTIVGGPTTPGMRRATTWDSGDDVWQQAGRPLQVDLHVPANSSTSTNGFQVAFYFRDFDNNRSETFTLTDTTHNTTVDTETVTSFANGIYYRYLIPADTNLTLTVTRTAGNNAILNGIFLDEVPAPPSGCATPGSIGSNFNGTAIAAGSSIWFNAVASISGLPSSGGNIVLDHQAVTYVVSGVTRTVSLPASTVTFSPSANQASTAWNSATASWVTTVPTSYSGNVFLGGGLLAAGDTGLPGGINPVTWSGTLHASKGVSMNWKWAAAVYTAAPADLAAVGAKPIDGSNANPYANSDHAGTPEAIKSYVTGGARGGGGSNWTGSYSGTASMGC